MSCTCGHSACGIVVEPFDLGAGVAVRQETQGVRHRHWIQQAPVRRGRHPDDRERRAVTGLEQTFHRRKLQGLVDGDVVAVHVARRHDLRHREHDADRHPEPNRQPPELGMPAGEQIVRAHRRHHNRGGDDRAVHDMGVLPPQKRVAEQGREAGQLHGAVRRDAVADRMLHPGVRGRDEEAGQPRARGDQHRGQPVEPRRDAALPEQQDPEERGFQEEREDALEPEGLPDDAAGKGGELGPVGAELKLHRDAGDHAHAEVEREDARPEPRRHRVARLAANQVQRLERDDERGEAHREDGEQIVEHDGERELEAVGDDRVGHLIPDCSVWPVVSSAVYLHTLSWRTPPRFPPARTLEEPALPYRRTPIPRTAALAGEFSSMKKPCSVKSLLLQPYHLLPPCDPRLVEVSYLSVLS